MTAPNIDSSTREKRLDYVLNEWKCLHNCEPMEQREQKPNKFGLCRVATEEDDSQPMEQREQKPNKFGLCRVATEEDDSQLCGKCHVLKGRSEEKLYADYIDGKRSYMDITLEIRSNR